MVEVVLAVAEVVVKDVDGEDLFDVLVVLSNPDMFGDGLGGAIEDTLEEVEVFGELDLDDDNLAEAVEGFDVHVIGFVVFVLSVALAFKELCDVYGFSDDGGDKAFEDVEVCFVAEHILGCPVETDDIVVFVRLCHDVIIIKVSLQR